MTMMTLTREQAGVERDSDLENRLQSIMDRISASEIAANEKDLKLPSRLRSIEDSIAHTISDIHLNLQNNMTSFMATISDRMDEHFLNARTPSVIPDTTTAPSVNTNCTTVPESGVYTFYLELIRSPVTVYCDQDTDGGGWIVFMRRQDGSVNFTRSWFDYKLGFGSPDGEFWAGNEFLHILTKRRPLQLRIDLGDSYGKTRFALYEEFQIGTEKDKYRLHVSNYSGTAGDSLINTRPLRPRRAGMQFSAYDSDNDEPYDVHCVAFYEGGWWYSRCFHAFLTGRYDYKPNSVWRGGPLTNIEMKIR